MLFAAHAALRGGRLKSGAAGRGPVRNKWSCVLCAACASACCAQAAHRLPHLTEDWGQGYLLFATSTTVHCLGAVPPDQQVTRPPCASRRRAENQRPRVHTLLLLLLLHSSQNAIVHTGETTTSHAPATAFSQVHELMKRRRYAGALALVSSHCRPRELSGRSTPSGGRRRKGSSPARGGPGGLHQAGDVPPWCWQAVAETALLLMQVRNALRAQMVNKERAWCSIAVRGALSSLHVHNTMPCRSCGSCRRCRCCCCCRPACGSPASCCSSSPSRRRRGRAARRPARASGGSTTASQVSCRRLLRADPYGPRLAAVVPDLLRPGDGQCRRRPRGDQKLVALLVVLCNAAADLDRLVHDRLELALATRPHSARTSAAGSPHPHAHARHSPAPGGGGEEDDERALRRQARAHVAQAKALIAAYLQMVSRLPSRAPTLLAHSRRQQHATLVSGNREFASVGRVRALLGDACDPASFGIAAFGNTRQGEGDVQVLYERCVCVAE